MTGNQSKNTDQHRRSLFRGSLPLESETVWFIFLSFLDVVLTYLLLRTGGFREANGIANWFFSLYGIRGMVYFKFAMVAFIAVIAQFVAQTRPNVARRLLIFGSILVGAVVVYSAYLLIWARFGV